MPMESSVALYINIDHYQMGQFHKMPHYGDFHNKMVVVPSGEGKDNNHIILIGDYRKTMHQMMQGDWDMTSYPDIIINQSVLKHTIGMCGMVTLNFDNGYFQYILWPPF